MTLKQKWFGVTSIDEPISATVFPEDFQLRNYPNPFNAGTNITFTLRQTAPVKLQIYNVRGGVVIDLLNSRLSTGLHTVRLDASGLSSGVYFTRLVVAGLSSVQKIT